MMTSQKNQEVMHAALEEAGSALRPGFAVIAKLNASSVLHTVEFDLETATDLAAVDMGSMTYTIATTKTLPGISAGDARVTETWRYQKDAGDLLEAGEVVAVNIDVRSAGIRPGDTFTIEMTAAGGATAALTRTVPTGIETNTYVELFC
jgi:flagellin FlaB